MRNIKRDFNRVKTWASKAVQNVKWYIKARKLLEDVDEKDYNLFETALKNQYDYNHSMKTYSDCDDDQIDALLIAAKHMYHALNVRHLIGCQPMNMPIGITYMLQYVIDEEDKDEESELEDAITSGKRIRLEIVQQAVEAGSRKLRTNVDPSIALDLKNIHNIDANSEIARLIGYSVAREVTNELLADVRALATKEKEWHEELPRTIRSSCSYIAMRSRRGAGNWIVVSPKMFDRIKEEAKQEPGQSFVGCEQKGMVVLPLVGTLNETIKIYVDDEAPDNEILVGYKGGNGECDAGYFYNPYVGLMGSGKVKDAETGEIVETLMTRYGKSCQFETEKRDESRYYSLITVK